MTKAPMTMPINKRIIFHANFDYIDKYFKLRSLRYEKNRITGVIWPIMLKVNRLVF